MKRRAKRKAKKQMGEGPKGEPGLRPLTLLVDLHPECQQSTIHAQTCCNKTESTTWGVTSTSMLTFYGSNVVYVSQSPHCALWTPWKVQSSDSQHETEFCWCPVLLHSVCGVDQPPGFRWSSSVPTSINHQGSTGRRQCQQALCLARSVPTSSLSRSTECPLSTWTSRRSTACSTLSLLRCRTGGVLMRIAEDRAHVACRPDSANQELRVSPTE